MLKFLNDLVAAKPSANGLAIIVANEGSCRPDHNHLSGAVKDLGAITKAFETLKFATVPIGNAFGQDIINIVDAAAHYRSYPASYRRLAFVFSGHGDHGCIYASDMEINLQKYIFDPWMPMNSPDLAKIPKLFFLDACRGSGVDQGMPIIQCYGAPVAKGGRSPLYGNYLLAYATMPTMQAFEQPAAGGYWMQHLARELQSNGNIECSLNDILTKVNHSVLEEMERHHCPFIQQPVLESTLHEVIYPLKEAMQPGQPYSGRSHFDICLVSHGAIIAYDCIRVCGFEHSLSFICRMTRHAPQCSS